MNLNSNDIKTEGVVKIRIDAVGGDLDRVAFRYPASFMNEMASQLTAAIEAATGVSGLAESSVELVMMFAPGTYMEHISGNVTYRRLMLIDAVSAPRDFWVRWTRLEAAEGEYTSDNILFELGEDVDQKVREKEYRYLLTTGKDKYHNSMGRKKVTEWREVIKRAAKRGELTKVETETELAPETLELEERIADLLGKRIESRNQPVKEEIPYITPENEEFVRAMEKVRLVVEESEDVIDEPGMPELADELIRAIEAEADEPEAAEPEELVFEEENDESAEDGLVLEEIPEDEESLEELPEPITDAAEEADEFDIFADDEEITEESLTPPEEEELEFEELDIFAEEEEPEIEEAPIVEENTVVAVQESPDKEAPIIEEAPVEENLPTLIAEEAEEELAFALDEPAEKALPASEEEPLAVDEAAEEAPIAEEAPVAEEEPEEALPSREGGASATDEVAEKSPAQTGFTSYEPLTQQISIADRVADIRDQLETKIRLEYEIRAREKAEGEVIKLRHQLDKLRTESEAEITELRDQLEELRIEHEHLLRQTASDELARAAEETRRRAEEAQLRQQIEAQLRAEAVERERLAEAARMAIEEQHRLEAENARIARQREEEERAEAERLRRIEEEKAIEAIRQAELERIRREEEEAKARAKAAMPDMTSKKYAYTSKTVKLLFRRSVDPNITTRIQEIIKATVDYYGKDNVYLRIKAIVPDSQTVILEFAEIPLEEMELLGNIIKILGNSGLGIAKAIIE